MLGKRGMAVFCVLMVALCVMMGVVCERAGLLFGYSSDYTASYTAEVRTLTVAPTRGGIFDCNGDSLLSSMVRYAMLIDPMQLDEADKAVLRSRFGALSELSGSTPFLVYSLEQPLQMKGVTSITLPRRYASGVLCIHLLGYTDSEGSTGLCGLEKSFNNLLTGLNAVTVRYSADGVGRMMPGFSPAIEQEGETEWGVTLTIDRRIQTIAEEACKDMEAGAAVVLDVQTGQIKAMVSRPGYDPEGLAQYLDSDQGEFVNRALAAYSPGSVFKTVVAACAIEQGLTDFTYCCEGSYDAGGVIFSCLKKAGHGDLNLTQAFCKSCNPYFIALANECGAEAVLEMANRLGLTDSISLADGVSSKGATLPQGSLTPAAFANAAIGQGDVSTSVLQVARLMATIANDGVSNEPAVVQSTTTRGGVTTRFDSGASRRVLSQSTAEQLQTLLILAVEEGTGAAAASGGVSVAGKTGSAEVGEDRVDGLFAGYFPVQDPKYAVCVLVEDGRTGGGSACPIVSEITGKMGELGLCALDK